MTYYISIYTRPLTNLLKMEVQFKAIKDKENSDNKTLGGDQKSQSPAFRLAPFSGRILIFGPKSYFSIFLQCEFRQTTLLTNNNFSEAEHIVQQSKQKWTKNRARR